MTATEKYKRAEALFNDRTKRELADMVVHRESDLEDARADNAKLRELVRHMNTCIEHYEPDGSVGCEHCPLNNDAGNCDYEQRMRDLGVEVDDD